ncbi:hypothetical protein VNO78_24171 [Psophocarpus tetragonolobus]|uniref:Uncharacterized protein n=1 Tax=Psophocarpus tetragonolobus TaxID=3891 RepID=A0AAN9S7Z5_PSOTE
MASPNKKTRSTTEVVLDDEEWIRPPPPTKPLVQEPSIAKEGHLSGSPKGRGLEGDFVSLAIVPSTFYTFSGDEENEGLSAAKVALDDEEWIHPPPPTEPQVQDLSTMEECLQPFIPFQVMKKMKDCDKMLQGIGMLMVQQYISRPICAYSSSMYIGPNVEILVRPYYVDSQLPALDLLRWNKKIVKFPKNSKDY